MFDLSLLFLKADVLSALLWFLSRRNHLTLLWVTRLSQDRKWAAIEEFIQSVTVAQSGPTLYNPVVYHDFSRQEYLSRFPFPSPGDLPNPGIELGCPALQADFLPSELPGKSTNIWCRNVSTQDMVYLSQGTICPVQLITPYQSQVKYHSERWRKGEDNLIIFAHNY